MTSNEQSTSFTTVCVCLICIYIPRTQGLPSPSGWPSSTFDEYMIEHEVSAMQAKNSALTLDPESLLTPFGCQKCTEAEIRYCEGVNFVHDHCCCDRRFHETLPYIPHTCYSGKQLCKPIVGHCDDYTKVRRCCCDRHALKLWKEKSSVGSISIPSYHRVLFIIFGLVIVDVFN